MSHQTGIQANAELKKYFGKCRDGKIRVLKISIENEQLVLSKYYPTKHSWEQDFDKYVPSLVVEEMPCYILYRFDSTNSLGHEWLLLSWSPDSAPVRHKMLYASTKATLKQEFGSAHIKDEMHATVKGCLHMRTNGCRENYDNQCSIMPRRRVRLAAAITILLSKNKKRSTWVRQWILRRHEAGAYHNLLKELQIEDAQQYFNFVGMTAVDLEVLLLKVGHVIKNRETHFLDSISPKERLLLTLRFLASGDSYHSLMYLFRIPVCTISNIVPEVCKALYNTLHEECLKDEVSLKGYKAHLTGVSAPAPLTDREEALKELQESEHDTNYGTDARQSTMGGVSFPITEDAKQGIHDLKRGSYNYLQFKIDLDEEEIHLSKAANISLAELPQQVPSDQARYHLYIFKHTHESDYMESIVFIYSMPGYNCSIKERMMYSSCKGQFLEIIEQRGVEIVKRLEIDDGKELTEEYLYDEIHPKRNLHRPAFAKPKGPPNRGAKRITKSQNSQ